MHNIMNKLMDVIMAHLANYSKHAHVSVNKGVKIHSGKVVEALLSEFDQIHKYDTFDPQHIDELPEDVRREALNLITMIKEKRDRRIKVRACADGRKQRKHISKEEVSSPTIQL